MLHFSSIYNHLLQHGFIFLPEKLSLCFNVFKFEPCVFLRPFGVITGELIFPISDILEHFQNKIPHMGYHIFFSLCVSKATCPWRSCSVLSKSRRGCKIPSGKVPFNLCKENWCFILALPVLSG